MKVLIIDNKTKHLRNLKKLLVGNNLTTVKYFGDYPPFSEFDLIVLSGGSKFAVMEYPEKFTKEVNLIKNSKTSMVGICEGCEIIAYAFGGKLEPFEPKEKGIREIEFFESLQIKNNLPTKVYEAHHYAIITLGKDLEGLAWSTHGYEIIKHKTKKIYGLQFHPEMLTDKLLGDDIFRRILKQIAQINL